MSSASQSTAPRPARRAASSRLRAHTVAMRESVLRDAREEPRAQPAPRAAAAPGVELAAGGPAGFATTDDRAAVPDPLSRAGAVDSTTDAPRGDGSDLAELATRLERRVRAHLPRCTLAVTLTDNRYTMISVRREGASGARHYVVRLHQMFASCGPAVTRALAQYIDKNDRDASRVLGDFIDGNQERVRAGRRRPPRIRITTRGRFHDLQAIYDDLNDRYFAGTIDARITWGQRTGQARRRNSIKMGSYSVEDRVIRIHRSLDRELVPRFFVEWIVYHEMLHQVHDIVVVGGRRCFHSREFAADEARFEHYAAARIWERAHLEQLLTY